MNVSLLAFRPQYYRTRPRLVRWMGIFTMIWVIGLGVWGGASLGWGADDFADGLAGAWQSLLVAGVAIACCPAALAALIRRRRPSVAAGFTVVMRGYDPGAGLGSS